MWQRVISAGDGALLLEFGQTLDPKVNRVVHETAGALMRSHLDGVWGVVPGFTTLLVEFDPRVTDGETLVDALSRLPMVSTDIPRASFSIPVHYGEELGPDLPEVSERLGLTRFDVVALHTEAPYQIYCIGFSPGFPLCGILPEALRLPRRSSPRTAVPAGSVAIAGAQAGVYPTESPGGWHVIGRTPAELFNIRRDPPLRYKPGDFLQFRAVDLCEYEDLEAQAREGYDIVREVPYGSS